MALKIIGIITSTNRQFIVGKPVEARRFFADPMVARPAEDAPHSIEKLATEMDVAVEDDEYKDIVEEISFNRPDNPYNKGFQVTGASYTVRIVGSSIRYVIPFSKVERIIVDTDAEDKNKKALQPEAISIEEVG